MVHHGLISLAIAYVIEWQESTYGVSAKEQYIHAGIVDWYNNTDIADPRELAACVIFYGCKYNKDVTYSDIQIITKDLFEDYQ